MSIISISGKINSGKNTIADIIQYLTAPEDSLTKSEDWSYTTWLNNRSLEHGFSDWKQKAFADKLKNIVCLLIGCTREQLEDREFKEKELGEEWKIYKAHYIDQYNDDFKIFLNRKEAEIWLDRGFLHTSIEEEILTPRKLLQTIGTDLFRDQLHSNVWINSLFADYRPIYGITSYDMKGYWKDKFIPCTKEVYDLRVQRHITEEDWKSYGKPIIKYPKWIITDLRFPNELQAVKDRGGLTIRVNRLNPEQKAAIELSLPEPFYKEHPSETALDHITDWDYVIDNNSDINSLIEKVKQILINKKII